MTARLSSGVDTPGLLRHKPLTCRNKVDLISVPIETVESALQHGSARMLRGCAAVVAVCACLVLPAEARADFRICNDTTSLVGVALGYRENNEWITEGWWQIPGETCAALIEGDLDSRFYYLFAEDADRGGQWRGNVFMCTSDKEFRITGVEDCFSRGYRKTGFFEIDTGNKESWMVRLTEQGQAAEPARQ